MPTKSWRGKSAVIRIYCPLTFNGYSNSIKAVKRQRNLGLDWLEQTRTHYNIRFAFNCTEGTCAESQHSNIEYSPDGKKKKKLKCYELLLLLSFSSLRSQSVLILILPEPHVFRLVFYLQLLGYLS